MDCSRVIVLSALDVSRHMNDDVLGGVNPSVAEATLPRFGALGRDDGANIQQLQRIIDRGGVVLLGFVGLQMMQFLQIAFADEPDGRVEELVHSARSQSIVKGWILVARSEHVFWLTSHDDAVVRGRYW